MQWPPATKSVAVSKAGHKRKNTTHNRLLDDVNKIHLRTTAENVFNKSKAWALLQWVPYHG
jgi:hypothetical protein